jgi:hypothetical protein
MIAVPSKVGTVFTKRLIEHDPCEFIERLRTQVRVIGSGKRGILITELRK